jgi:hypothetical protein
LAIDWGRLNWNWIGVEDYTGYTRLDKIAQARHAMDCLLRLCAADYYRSFLALAMCVYMISMAFLVDLTDGMEWALRRCSLAFG